MDPVDVTHFETPEGFRQWLQNHHGRDDALWVGYWKKATGRPSITWEESVDEALCFGWIDGIRKRVDHEAYTVRFTRRRPGSIWSLRNIERFEALRIEGRVHAPGEAAYARRSEERSGVYSFERVEPARLSPDFEARFRQHPEAWIDWQSRPPGYRRRATHWVMSAKREATRERRLAALIDASANALDIRPLRRNRP